jgi:hypothetical protein
VTELCRTFCVGKKGATPGRAKSTIPKKRLSMVPAWLHVLAIASLLFGLASGLLIAVDETRHPQHMGIMNLVWPITALFGSAFVVTAYYRYGRFATHQGMKAVRQKSKPPNRAEIPFAIMVAKSAGHCGAGCTVGDIIVESLAFFVPAVATWFGYQTLFAEKMFAVWILDYIFAFAIGIAFQYFTITPMRKLSPLEGIVRALKADVLSLTAWQLGMYGFMALAQFYLFDRKLGVRLQVNSAEFWFIMQIAMIAGFVTSYPANWWLVARGIKQEM